MDDLIKMLKRPRKVCRDKITKEIRMVCIGCFLRPFGSQKCKRFRKNNNLEVAVQHTPMSLVNKLKKERGWSSIEDMI